VRRTLWTTACLAALPALLAAQVATQQGSPSPAPTNKDSGGPSSVIFRVGGFMINGQRNYAFNNSVQQGTGTVKGIEGLLQGDGIGLSVRSLTGSFTNTNGGAAQPDVISADANVLLGTPTFAVSLGASRRALSSTTTNATRIFTFGRVGCQMSFLIGGSRLRAQLCARGYVPASNDSKKIGAEGEGSIIYAMPVLPVFLQVGYRTEVFTPKVGTLEAPEEVRGLRIGGGIQFGGK
jgi:hypothetical protein